MDFNYRFPVVKGIQAGHEYFIAMVPLRMIPRLFPSDEEYVLPEYRAQRKLNVSRIPAIRNYILNNRETYVFSALAASIDGEFSFIPDSNFPDLGVLEVSMDAKFLINDGQHRKAAILEAIREDESLLNETISVVFFEDQGLARSQQMFTDLNKHAVKTSNSIAELYDSRDALAVVTRHVINSIPFLNTYTDKEKDNLGKYSSNLFTLNTFYAANRIILGSGGPNEAFQAFLIRFWNAVTDNMLLWKALDNKEIPKNDIRENYIVTQGVLIQAFGRIGKYYYRNGDSDMEEQLSKIQNINWRRNAEHWMMRAINEKGRVITNNKAILLIGNYIKQEIGIPLSEDELAAESKII